MEGNRWDVAQWLESMLRCNGSQHRSQSEDSIICTELMNVKRLTIKIAFQIKGQGKVVAQWLESNFKKYSFMLFPLFTPKLCTHVQLLFP